MAGLKIGNFHSFDDFKLKMLSFEVSDPEVQEQLQEVPGRNGVLDLSESLTGEPTYKNRAIVAEFDMEEADPETAKQKLKDIRNCIHGKYLKIIDDTEPEYYYEGRVKVSCKRKNYLFYLVTVTVDAQPYKLKHEKTTVIAKIDGEAVVVCQNERRSYVPTIISDAEMNLVFNDSSYSIGAGTYILPDMKFIQGDNIITCTGTGTITFTYREGAL